MERWIPSRTLVICVLLTIGNVRYSQAGMPSPLPTSWTAENEATGNAAGPASSAVEARWQALSFFIACLLLSAWGMKGLWNSLRRDLTWLPTIGFRGALSLVLLWGFLFVIVLTMISGARELMTPGAWKKQGWTYKLVESRPPDDTSTRDLAFEQLRFALWNYAANHAGQFPAESDPSLEQDVWQIPGWGGTRYLYVSGRSVTPAGHLLAFEPELDGRARRVLLTNGVVGNLRTPEVERLLAGDADR